MPRWPPNYIKKPPKSPRRESTDTQRAPWLGMHDKSVSIRQIAKDCGVNYTTVGYAIRMATVCSMPLCGRYAK